MVVRCEELTNEKCLECCLAYGEHCGIISYYYYPLSYEGNLDLEVRERYFLTQKKKKKKKIGDKLFFNFFIFN